MSPRLSGGIFFWLVVGCRLLAWLALAACSRGSLWPLARVARSACSRGSLRLLAWLAPLARVARFGRRRRARRDDWRKSLCVALNFVLEEGLAVARVRSGTTRVPLVRPISRLLGAASSPRRAAFIGCRGRNA